MSYVNEFNALFKPLNSTKLRDKALDGELRNSSFRSLCWRYFLHCLPDKSTDQWCDKCRKDRRDYETIRDRHAVDPRREDQQDYSSNDPSSTVINNNPLSQDANSPWNRYFADSRLRNVIRQDVVRTFPDMEFFRSADIQAILQNVLFYFARENPKLSYKQGMHELLASLLFVIHRDIQTCIIANEGGLANELITTLLDMKYLEHDVYMTFSQLMQTIETWYQNDEILPMNDDVVSKEGGEPSSTTTTTSTTSTTTTNASVTDNNTNGRTSRSSSVSKPSSSSSFNHHVRSVLGLKLKMISESIVKRHDCELYNHLDALQIAPQIFGIRWMRLLFGREFPFMDLLVVWDAIIGDGISFALTDYIFASMLITIRELLVNSDYTDCLNYLMRYPSIKDIQVIIKFALHLREPQRYAMPALPYSAHRYLEQHQQAKQKLVPIKLINEQASQQQATRSTSNSSNHHHRNIVNKPPMFQAITNHNKQATRQQATTSSQQQQRVASNQAGPARLITPTIRRSQPRELYSIAPSVSHQARQLLSSSSSPSTPRSSSSSLRSNHKLNAQHHNDSLEHDDLPTKVDYCWRLLSAQIDSLQRCLPKEKNLNSEDEIYIALAQLKKVRDVLKGSLKLEDELGAAAQVEH